MILLQKCTKNENQDLWLLRNGVRQTYFFVFLRYFMFFYTYVAPSWPCDILFLRYQEQQTEYLVIWAIFGPFITLIFWKIKIFKKWRKKSPGYNIIIFHLCITNDNLIWCIVPEIWSITGGQAGIFLPFYPTSNPKNQNF